MSKPNLRSVGRAAEDQAAEYLISHGYTIVTRRYTGKGGEIDLVALDGDMLVFVEVKHRRTGSFLPEENVDSVKEARIYGAAEHYLHTVGEASRPVRYDVIAIDRNGLRHYRDCFRK